MYLMRLFEWYLSKSNWDLKGWKCWSFRHGSWMWNSVSEREPPFGKRGPMMSYGREFPRREGTPVGLLDDVQSGYLDLQDRNRTADLVSTRFIHVVRVTWGSFLIMLSQLGWCKIVENYRSRTRGCQPIIFLLAFTLPLLLILQQKQQIWMVFHTVELSLNKPKIQEDQE